jgi:hypothetical protein
MSEPEFFVMVGEETAGPFSTSQLAEMLRNGELNRDSVCARLGEKEWTPVSDIVSRAHGRHASLPPRAELSSRPPETKPGTSLVTMLVATVTVFGSLVLCGLVPEFGYVLAVVFGFLVYFFPSYLARNNRNFVAIAALNLLLGWTLLGWVGALIWALYEEKPQPYR